MKVSVCPHAQHKGRKHEDKYIRRINKKVGDRRRIISIENHLDLLTVPALSLYIKTARK